MPTELTWLGHGCWSIDTGEYKIVLDPFLDESPTATMKSSDVAADFILISHGHGDHVGDCVSIAKRTGATVISNYEICEWLSKQGVEKTDPHNLGGGSQQPFGRVQLTLAHHSSVLPDGANGGNPSGFLLTLADGKIYFACDTALFRDMKTIGTERIDLAVLPIGDRFTMGPTDSIKAIQWIAPKAVAPSHYNTWPAIAQDVEAWVRHVKNDTYAEPRVIPPGGKIKL
jgi:L-ascorbate metabolism protein UlaG (beta-lactamase superfamily)